MKMRLVGMGTLLPVLIPLAALAQDATGDAEFFGEFPVVLTASRLEQPANEAPASVTVIDREMIRASGVRELADLFRLVPGMVVGRARGYAPMLGYSGFGNSFFRQFQVLLDGVSIYSPLYGGVEWGELPISLDDIERIEVVRGPNAAAYGANSFLGVVNIITRDPATDPAYGATINIGDDHIADESVRIARSVGDWRYRISLGQRADQGLESVPDSRRSNFVNIRAHDRLSAVDELRVQFSYSGGYGEDSLRISNGEYPTPSRFEAKTLQLRWTRAANADDEFWLQLFHMERTQHETLPYTLNLTGFGLGSYDYLLNQNYDHRRTDLEMQQTFRLWEGLRGVWGSQAREEGARSQLYFGRQDWQTSQLVRLFGNLEWRLAPTWLLNAGAMYERNSLTGGALSPSLALLTHLSPEHSLRVRFSKARRTPTLFEDRADMHFDSPPGLKALLGPPLNALPFAQSYLQKNSVADEKISSKEISYMGEFPGLRMNLEVTAYYDHLRDMIAQYEYAYPSVVGILSGAPLTTGFRNLDWANRRGINLNLRWQPRPGTRLDVVASRSIVESSNIDVNWSASAPRHTVGALWSEDLASDVSASLAYFHVDTMSWTDSGNAAMRLPDYDRFDVRLAKRFRWGGHRAELAWVTQNWLKPIPVSGAGYLDRRTSWLSLRYEY